MALAFLLPVKMMAKASSSDNSTLLWYNAPAQQWLEALPIGNNSPKTQAPKIILFLFIKSALISN